MKRFKKLVALTLGLTFAMSTLFGGSTVLASEAPPSWIGGFCFCPPSVSTPVPPTTLPAPIPPVTLPETVPAMVFYTEFPTVPDFAWVVREHLNVSHIREYMNQETATLWGGNRSVSYIYDISQTLSDGFLARFDLIADIAAFSDFKEVVAFNTYIQILLEEGFERINPEDFRGVSRFQAGNILAWETLQKDDISIMILFIIDGHGTPPHIEITFDMGN